MKNRFSRTVGTLLFISLHQTSQGASAVWNGTSDAIWSTAANWSTAPVPGTGDTATFNNAGGAVDVIDLGAGGVAIGSILFDTAASAYTIGSGAVNSQTLTLDDNGTISANSTVAANQLFNAKLTLGPDGTTQTYTITNNSTTNTLSVAGGISGGTGGTAGTKTLNVSAAPFANGGITLSGAITNGGADSLALSVGPVSGSVQVNLGNTGNTYSGGTSISANTRLNVNGGTGKGLGTGLVTVASGGQAYLNSAGTYTNSFSISGTYTDSFGAIRMGVNSTIGGNITLNANSSIGVDSGRFGTINGNITGAFNLTKVSTGTVGLGSPLTLGGTNDYSGTTTVTSGVISFANKSAFYNGNTVDWVPAKVSVAANTGIALGVGDPLSGYWDAAGVAAFLGGTQMGTSTPTTGFKSGSYIGFDTANATGGTFTYSNAIGNIGTALNNGVVKLGAGTLVLDVANTYSGGTSVLAGTLNLASTGSISGSTLSVNPSAIFSNTGGAVTFTGSMTPAGGTIAQSAGTITAPGISTSGSADFGFINITGGSVTIANDIALGRTSFSTTGTPSFTTPLAAATNSGLYINGLTAAVSSSSIGIGVANSNVSARLDLGNFTVTGAVTLGKYSTNSTRYSVLQINGGTFSAADTTHGVVISPNGGAGFNQTGNAEFYLSGGTSTVGRIAFGSAADTAGGNGFLILDGGTLYVGAGGIVKASTIGGYNYTVGLKSGTLGAASDWSSALNISLGTNPSIQAADSTNAARDITLSGVLSGSGAGFTKTGDGKLTLTGAANSYTGTTAVTAGTLALVGGSQSSPIIVSSGATLGFAISSPTTSSSTVTFSGATAKVSVSGTPAATTLMTATSITGTPVLDPAISGFVLAIEDGGTTLKLKAAANNYNTWADTNSVSGQAANLDHDNDGVSNGVEYFLVGPVTPSTGFTPLPGVTVAGATRSITWIKAGDYTGNYGSDFVVETSTTLAPGSWSSETLDPAPGSTVTISGNNVTYTFPAGPVKTFARLKVTGP